MKTYTTSQVAREIGVHPNTVRLYEELALIPKAVRRPNGYRVFTCLHLDQLRLARAALKFELLQNGLRGTAVELVKASAAGDYDRALMLAGDYLSKIQSEKENAEQAVRIAGELLSRAGDLPPRHFLKRKEAAAYLHVTADTLRNWELNGLMKVKRKQNGYRVYTDTDLRRLRIIRALRCANYSLSAILRLLNTLSRSPQVDMRQVIDTPRADETLVSICDRLLTSLDSARENALALDAQLRVMKKKYGKNPPL